MENDQQFLDQVVKSLVDNPSAVVINRSVDEMGVLLTLTVHPDDMGKVIGKQRSMYESIRTLIHVIGAKNKQRISLFILEPNT